MTKIKHPEGIKIIGTHRFVKCTIDCDEAREVVKNIEACIAKGDGYMARKYMDKLERWKSYERTYKNIVTTVGRTVLAELITGNFSGSPEINYGAVGDGTTTPANSDTTLVNEVFRKTIANNSNTINVANVDHFYNQTEANQQFLSHQYKRQLK